MSQPEGNKENKSGEERTHANRDFFSASSLLNEWFCILVRFPEKIAHSSWILGYLALAAATYSQADNMLTRVEGEEDQEKKRKRIG